jgi:hypothetical protein
MGRRLFDRRPFQRKSDRLWFRRSHFDFYDLFGLGNSLLGNSQIAREGKIKALPLSKKGLP